MTPADLMGTIDSEQPYDDALDPFLRAFIHFTFRETRREVPETEWLQRIAADTPAAVASMMHATAHYSVRWDKPFRDVLSFGLAVPSRQPFWSPELGTRAHLLDFGSMDWATIFVTWSGAGAQLLLCDEEENITDYGTLEGFVAEGLEMLVREPPESDSERHQVAEVLDAYRVHIASWAEKLQRRADACRSAAAEVQQAMESLDLESDGAEAALDELGLDEARLADRIAQLDRSLWCARNALEELGDGARDASQ